MNLFAKSFCSIFGMIILYLLLVPVEIDPKSWNAPENRFYTGVFAPNNDLSNLTQIDLPEGMHGPEDIVALNGKLYISTQNGWLLTFDPDTSSFSKFAETGGKPLGLEVWNDTIIVADAYKGLLQVTERGDVNLLTDHIGEDDMVYVDDLDITENGRRVIIDNLPGFPDNINKGPDGTYFVGLVSMRSDAIDKLSDKPFIRKIIWRLPSFIRPAPQNYGFILQLSPEGEVLRTWQDAAAGFPSTTGAIVVDDRLYVSSLTSKTLGYRPYP